MRYGARGPVAESRLTRLADGRYRYAPKGDGPAVDFTAEALVRRLVALLPPAHKHLTTFHGVYAPNASLRPVVMRPAPEAPDRRPSPSQPELRLVGPADDTPAPASPKPQSPRLDWATLQARTFGTDVWSCPCGGRRRVLAVVSSPNTAQAVLQRLGLLEPRRAFCSHGPAPPQLSLPL